MYQMTHSTPDSLQSDQSPETETRARRLSDRREPAMAMLSLNITPMIDVVFLLLIYFILSFDFRPREESFSLEAPSHLEGAAVRTLDPFELPKRPIGVLVRSHGDGATEYSLSTDDPTIGPVMGADDLYRRLRDARGQTIADDQVFSVRAGPDVRWEHTMAAFNALRRAGFQHVRFANPQRLPSGAGG